MELSAKSFTTGDVQVERQGEKLVLMPERAVFVVSGQTLLVADLHWGKAQTFQAQGIRVPSELLQSDLRRLSQAAERCGARRVLVLGDLVDSPRHLGSELILEIAKWRDTQNFAIELVPGNHDRGLTIPSGWRIEIRDDPLREGNFLYSHDPVEKRPTVNKRAASHSEPGSFKWSGHVHPMLRLKSGADSLRAPCFVLTQTTGLLPAFSEFTGGFDMCPRANEEYYLIAENQVVRLGSKK